jgi:cytochrome c556
MKPAKIGLFSLGLAVVVGSGLVAFGAKMSPDRGTMSQAAAQDVRRPVLVPAAGREAVLAEMRLLMSALHGVLDGLSRSDLERVSQSAASGGLGSAVDMDPAVRQALPPEFLKLGVATHSAFDSLAAAASAGASPEEILRRAASLSANCVACHATYRLEVK